MIQWQDITLKVKGYKRNLLDKLENGSKVETWEITLKNILLKKKEKKYEPIVRVNFILPPLKKCWASWHDITRLMHIERLQWV